MLKHLYIRNFVLIDEVEVSFDKGMSVITGETGAGKSILFGALSLLKGRRADLAELKDKKQKSILEARIDVSKYRLRKEFEAENLDYLDEAIFRREVNPEGKSRAFINDTPVRLEQMQKLGDLLFDIHSQHQSMELNDADYRLSILDEMADTSKPFLDYKLLYSSFKELEKKNETLKEEARLALQEQDYLQFQFEELSQLNLKVGEDEELENEHRLLANGDQMMSIVNQIMQVLDSDNSSTLSDIHSASQNIEQLADLNPKLTDLKARFTSAEIEIRDIANEVESFRDSFEFDVERLQTIEERMADIHRLKQKHARQNVEELLQYINELESRLQSMGNFENEIEANELKLKQLKSELSLMAKGLSSNRIKYFPVFSKAVVSTLQKLGIPQANFQIGRTETDLGANGIDKIEFLFSANAGKEVQAIRQVASGGELSRIMLAIKRELARKKHMPALLFDEIDTGVSGEVADQLGNILREMAETHQILSITHLPQLAAKGRHHYFVFKQNNEIGISQTFIKRLTEEGRVDELAKMLSGEKVSDAAINNARELLANKA